MSDPTQKKKNRPAFFDIFYLALHLGLPGYISFLHRVSGTLLFLATFWLLFLLDRSLASPEQFAFVKHYLSLPLVKLPLLVLLWSFLHHFFAGIRFLFIDVHVGVDLPAARKTSVVVLALSLALTALIGARLW